MKELQDALGDSLSLLKEEYLNPSRLGTDSECVGDVLLDFKDDAPVFFQFKKASSYFVYKDTKDLINFIRLFITQIRARMDSDACSFPLLSEIAAFLTSICALICRSTSASSNRNPFCNSSVFAFISPFTFSSCFSIPVIRLSYSTETSFCFFRNTA